MVWAQTLPEFPLGRVFKVNIWLEGCRVHDFLLIGWWRGNRVMFGNLNRQPSGSSQSGVYVLVVSM